MNPVNHIHYKKHCAICNKMFSWCRCPEAGTYKKLHGVCDSCRTLSKDATLLYKIKENPIEPLRLKTLMLIVGDINYYWVDDEEIANKFTADFLEGGHWLVYSFIPKNEIWISVGYDWGSTCDIVWHETDENQRMQLGKEYNMAHKETLHVEDFCRQNAAGQPGTDENNLNTQYTDAAKY